MAEMVKSISMAVIDPTNAFQSCTLLINPQRYPQFVKILKKIIRRTKISKVIETESRAHFVSQVKTFFKSKDRHLLVWGGDGTAHLALNAYMDALKSFPDNKDKVMGFLRGGSGNGIQDSYEVPFFIKNQLTTYAESIRNGYIERVDILKVDFAHKTFYCQLFGLGFDAQVLKKRESRTAWRGKNRGNPKPGILNYAYSGAYTFLKNYKNVEQEYRIQLHKGKYAYRGYRVNAEFPFNLLERNVSLPLIELGTRPYYGKLFKICPDVVCNNGFMDVYFYKFPDKWSILRNIRHIWQGSHDKINKHLTKRNKPVIERYEVKKTVIESRDPLVFHLDGDLHTLTPGSEPENITISILPRRIPLLVPGSFYRKFHPF